MYKVSLIGNLTKDPEFTTTKNGLAKTDISICCNTGKDNKIYEEITLWDKDAEIAARYLVKGKGVYIEADVYDDSWTDDNGLRRPKRSLKCRFFKFI